MGWIADREADPAVVRALKEIDAQADVIWVPGPSERPPVWEFGVWWDPPDETKDAAVLALDRHLDMARAHHKPQRIAMLQNIIRGWRPIFAITGRDPQGRDVEEFRRRDWTYRHNFERELEAIEARMEPSEEERQERVSRLARDLADDKVLYHLMTRGRKSVVVPGLKTG